MTLPRHRLEEAAFWHFGVCLDCQALIDADALGGLPTACPECSSTNLMLAERILEVADFVEDEL